MLRALLIFIFSFATLTVSAENARAQTSALPGRKPVSSEDRAKRFLVPPRKPEERLLQMCELPHCFASYDPEGSTVPLTVPSVGHCRADGSDTYYRTRLHPPAEACDDSCSVRSNRGLNRSHLATLSRSGSRIRRECIARSLQRSPVVAAEDKIGYCAGENSAIRTGEKRPPLCPSTELVDFLSGWTDQALKCMDSRRFEDPALKSLKLDPETLFAIINHESSWNMNASSRIGNGLFQLTSAPINEFYSSNRSLRKFWEAARENPDCAAFEPAMKANSGKKPNAWQCSVTSPEGIGRQFVIGLANLYACRETAEREVANGFKWSQLKSARNGQRNPTQEKERLLRDLVLTCHNWGVGNMQIAFRAVRGLTYKDQAEFRRTLLTKGWKETAQMGVQFFIPKVEGDLNMIKGEAPLIAAKALKSCVE